MNSAEKAGLVRIGEDVQETAHYRRPIVYILRRVFPKYARVGDPDAGTKQAERPPALITGDRYDTSFAAEIVAAKYSYHLPIYRQEDLFAGCGIRLSRSTLLNIQQAAADVLRRLAEHFADLVRSDHCVGSDDTGVRLLLPKDVPKVNADDPKSGRVAEVIAKAKAENRKSILAKMWAYRGASIPIDNNDCEQLMKQIALGRKNWLFTGSVRAGYRSADLMTICSSAIRNNLDVFAYVKDALDQLIADSTDYDSLRPDVWAKSHPESVRDYRIDEKRERGARRDRQRLERRLAKLC